MMYTPLNIKTEYSLLNSMIKIPDLVRFAKENNISSLSITDNNLFGVAEFYKTCLENKIKPIIGLDVLLNNNHILLYAKNFNGYQNLIKLSTIISEKSITVNDLKKYASNLICILPYSSFSIVDSFDFYSDLYIGYNSQQEYEAIKNYPKVYVKEILYLNKEDGKYLNYLKAIQNNTTIREEQKQFDNYFVLEQDLPFDLTNNYYITECCNVELEFKKSHIPKFSCPNGYTSCQYLKELCKEGLKKKFGDKVSIKYIERLKYELKVIEEMNFCDYFLIVWDYVNFAKDHHILVGPGRGSSAGSLVSYCLNIIEVDPLKYNLFFERFLNKDRITMPDIDIDFDTARREEVIEYCKEKYGLKNVCSIITFSSLTSKQVLKDIGRVLELSPELVDYFTRMFKAKVSLQDNVNQSDRIKNHLNKNPELKKLLDIALKLENLKKHISSHASGIVISDEPLDNIVPLTLYGGEYLIGYTMDYLEALGLIKMDFLGLKTLTTIDHILQDIKEVDYQKITFDDSTTIDIFQKGETMGIFQFESQGMINLLRKMKPTNFEELYHIIALYRPGPMGNIDTFIKRRNGKEQVNYFHPNLINILRPTYGIIIYQEQIMQIANVLAGYTLGEADLLRRAMSKKKGAILLAEKDKFIERSIKNGYDKELVENIYNLILKFAEYGFPKAHAVAYSMISYKMAYLKANYPNLFMKNMLNSVIGSEHDTKDYIVECHELGIMIMNPDINKSGLTYENINGQLLFPLLSIKNIGFMAVNYIVKEREKAPFLDIYDFIKRIDKKIINRTVLENLIYSGSLDCFHLNRKTMIQNLDILLNYADLLNDLGEEYVLKPEITEYDEFSKNELLFYEHQVLGFYLNNHPVNEYRKKYHKPISISSISNYLNKVIDIIVSVDSLRESRTKNGELICFMRVSDELLTLDAPIFSSAYKEVPDIAVNDIIKITGKAGRRNGKDQLIVNRVEIIEHVDSN